MVSGRMPLCRPIALPFFRFYMNEHRPVNLFRLFKNPHHLRDIVTVDGPHIGNIQIFKQHPRHHHHLF